jgi:excisionase family DNA binding protein
MSWTALPLVLTTRQAAEYLSLAETTLEKYRVYGGGPLFVRLGRAVRYRLADLDGWLASCIRTSTSDTGDSRLGKREAPHAR